MGICASKKEKATVEEIKSKAIDQQLKEQKRESKPELKLLLLGAGESGKSTIFKQMKIIHSCGYSESEKMAFIHMIRKHCVENMSDLIAGARVLNLLSTEDLAFADGVLSGLEREGLHIKHVTNMTKLWQKEELQTAYKERSRFQLCDSAQHFLDSLERITAPDYVPTYDDILLCRVRTTGVSEMSFAAADVKFKMVDVGGQRNERRKWIHCFEGVEAVIFVAAISEYDQVLFEDEGTNRLQEALRLFREMSSTRFFCSTPIILFLNKKDLFEAKIESVDLRVCFPEYTGGQRVDEAVSFIQEQFKQARQSQEQEIFIHVTTATSTGNIRFVFDSVQESILLQNINGAGIL